MEEDPKGASIAPPVSFQAPSSASSNIILSSCTSFAFAKHDSVLRRKTGNGFKVNDASIDILLYSQIQSLSTSIKFSNSELHPLYAVLPQTTRGLGFTVQQTFSELLFHNSDVSKLLIPTFRCVLAAHWYIQSLAGHFGNYQHLAKERSIPEPFSGFNKLVEEHHLTFNACAAALSCYGNCKRGGCVYLGFHPEFTPSHQPVEDAASLSDVENLDVHSQLNPYTISFNNLRNIVLGLSSHHTPVDVRRYFIERNPLPGAIFHQDLLENPDDIMPQSYSQNQLATDFALMREAIALGASQVYSCVSTVEMTGMASAGMFVNVTAPRMCIVDGIITCTSDVISSCCERISASDYVLGYLSMVGEDCDRQTNHHSVYGLRRLRNSTKRRDLKWGQLVRSLY